MESSSNTLDQLRGVSSKEIITAITEISNARDRLNEHFETINRSYRPLWTHSDGAISSLNSAIVDLYHCIGEELTLRLIND